MLGTGVTGDILTEEPYRIVVTAWRDWPQADAAFIWNTLSTATEGIRGRRRILVAHGQCPYGGGDYWTDLWALVAGAWARLGPGPDAVCDYYLPDLQPYLGRGKPYWHPLPPDDTWSTLHDGWTIKHMVRPQRYPAEWGLYGRAAGPKRNARMIALSADACLAFPGPNSRGTLGCLAMAQDRGIPTTVYPWEMLKERHGLQGLSGQEAR